MIWHSENFLNAHCKLNRNCIGVHSNWVRREFRSTACNVPHRQYGNSLHLLDGLMAFNIPQAQLPHKSQITIFWTMKNANSFVIYGKIETSSALQQCIINRVKYDMARYELANGGNVINFAFCNSEWMGECFCVYVCALHCLDPLQLIYGHFPRLHCVYLFVLVSLLLCNDMIPFPQLLYIFVDIGEAKSINTFLVKLSVISTNIEQMWVSHEPYANIPVTWKPNQFV